MRLRVYTTRFKSTSGSVRAIIHDGTRWRRLSDPWQMTSERSVAGVRMAMQARNAGYPEWPMPETVTTVSAPGYDNVEVHSVEYVGGARTTGSIGAVAMIARPNVNDRVAICLDFELATVVAAAMPANAVVLRLHDGSLMSMTREAFGAWTQEYPAT